MTLRSADPTWRPVIDAGYSTEDEDVDALVAGTRVAQPVAAGSAMAPSDATIMIAERAADLMRGRLPARLAVVDA